MLRPIISLFLIIELVGKGCLSKVSSLIAESRIVPGNEDKSSIIAESRIVAKNETNSSKIAQSIIAAENENISPIIAESRIVAGYPAIAHSVPYAAYIDKKKTTKPGSQSCTGSLLSRNWVVTAGHCAVDLKSQKITLGTHNHRVHEPSTQKFEITIDATHVIKHEKFDIALIKLPRPAELNRYVKAVKLPSLADQNNEYVYKVGRASGWGHTNDIIHKTSSRIRTVRLMIISNKECLAKMKKYIANEELCTQGAFGKGTCQGDSGGPLVVNDVLVGVTSWGDDLCEGGKPSVWMRVTSFLSWIKEHTDVNIN